MYAWLFPPVKILYLVYLRLGSVNGVSFSLVLSERRVGNHDLVFSICAGAHY